MNILFLNQRPVLATWENRSFSPDVMNGPRAGDNHDHHARVVGIEPVGEPLANGPFHRVAHAIFEYRIFPESLVRPVVSRVPVQCGDTIGIHYHAFPGIWFFMACRVINVFDEAEPKGWRKGFTYRTLDGHAAIGEETFAVEKNAATGEVTASLSAWSRPSHWLMRLGYPLARQRQLQAGRLAVEHLRELALIPMPP